METIEVKYETEIKGVHFCSKCGFDEGIKNSCDCVNVKCENCTKTFNSNIESSSDDPNLCDDCWCKKQDNKTQFVEFLESLVMQRFENIEQIETKIKERFKVLKCPIDHKTRYEDEVDFDFNLIGNINKKLLFCDFDIYYLKDNSGKLFITEVGYEFE